MQWKVNKFATVFEYYATLFGFLLWFEFHCWHRVYYMWNTLVLIGPVICLWLRLKHRGRVEANANAICRKKLSEWGLLRNQLRNVVRVENVLGVTVNLLMCDRGGALYSVIATVHVHTLSPCKIGSTTTTIYSLRKITCVFFGLFATKRNQQRGH